MFLNKNIIVCFSTWMILVFILQVSMNTSIYVRFKSDQTYISKELCVNRFDETNTCKGKCYLKSQLQKSEASTSALQGCLKYKIDLFLVSDPCKEVLKELFVKRIYVMYAGFYVNEPLIDFFHPPA